MKNIQLIGTLFVLLLTASPQVVAQYVTEEVVPTGRIVGKVQDSDGKPVRDAVVVAYHVSGKERFASAPTGGNGKYKLENLPFGYFDVGVETSGGVFVADRAINLPPAGKAELTVTIEPFQPGTQNLSRNHPASESDPGGVALLRAKAKGRDFWRSPKGIAVLGAAGGAALLAIASGSNDEATATIF
jgi:hypothetical protein